MTEYSYIVKIDRDIGLFKLLNMGHSKNRKMKGYSRILS